MGGSWRMPTRAEWEELFSCEWDLLTINDMIDAIRVLGKNKNFICLPISHNGMSIARSFSEGISWYWSSSLHARNSHEAWGVTIKDEMFDAVEINPSMPIRRNSYCFIRGVLDK
jgi:hypothetical protein